MQMICVASASTYKYPKESVHGYVSYGMNEEWAVEMSEMRPHEIYFFVDVSTDNY